MHLPLNSLRRWLLAAALLLPAAAPAAVFYTETFDSGTAGWTDRDPGELTAGASATVGNPAGSLRGSFGTQLIPTPQTDALRAGTGASGGNFAGNYYADVAGFTGFKFEFYSTNVLPTDLSVRFGNGTNTFTLAVGYQVPSLGVWYTVGVPLDYSWGWFGGTAAQFSNTLSSVSFVEVQITRNGGTAQSYYVDNFRLVNELIFVPEPASGLFWFGWALVFGGLRRKLTARRSRSPYALPLRAVGNA